MAHFYEIVKHNAQKFADERNQSVWICKAKRKTDYCIIFSLDQLTKNYEIFEEVKPTVKGDTYMPRKFTVDASKKIEAARRPNWIRAAKGEDAEDPRVIQMEDLQDKVADDFDYVMSGIERLGREGMMDEAISILNTLSDTLNSAVGIIGGDFDQATDITEEI